MLFRYLLGFDANGFPVFQTIYMPPYSEDSMITLGYSDADYNNEESQNDSSFTTWNRRGRRKVVHIPIKGVKEVEWDEVSRRRLEFIKYLVDKGVLNNE